LAENVKIDLEWAGKVHLLVEIELFKTDS